MPKDIAQELEFSASTSTLYSAFVDSEKHSVMTGSPAQIKAEAGALFQYYGDFLTGVVVDLVENKRIVQAWRAKDWPEGHYSIVSLTFEQTEAGSKISLQHLGIPDDKVDDISEGWHRQYWNKLRPWAENAG